LAHSSFIFHEDSTRYQDTLKTLKQSDIIPIASGGMASVPFVVEVITPKSVVIPITKEVRSSLACTRDSLKLLKDVNPRKGLKKFIIESNLAKDLIRGPSVKDFWKELPHNSRGPLKSSSGGPDQKDGGSKMGTTHKGGGDKIDDKEHSRPRTQGAISAYNVTTLSTMMVVNDFTPATASERPNGNVSHALEEAERKLWEVNADHHESVRELKGNAEKKPW